MGRFRLRIISLLEFDEIVSDLSDSSLVNGARHGLNADYLTLIAAQQIFRVLQRHLPSSLFERWPARSKYVIVTRENWHQQAAEK
jgi:hypothetical protein